jgi:hypothetical protein
LTPDAPLDGGTIFARFGHLPFFAALLVGALIALLTRTRRPRRA